MGAEVAVEGWEDVGSACRRAVEFWQGQMGALHLLLA